MMIEYPYIFFSAMDVTNKLKSQAKAEYVKMSSLNINREYCIKWLRSHESSYGRTIVATVDGNLQVYLPKSINLTEKEIEEFNKGNEKLSLVYHGKNGNAYNFSFI